MSTLPPKADKAQTCLHVRFVPIAAVSNRSKKNTRSPRRRRQAAQVARSGRAHARRLVVKLAAETPEMGKFPVNFPVSREFVRRQVRIRLRPQAQRICGSPVHFRCSGFSITDSRPRSARWQAQERGRMPLNTAQCILKHRGVMADLKRVIGPHGLYREASQRFINGRDWWRCSVETDFCCHPLPGGESENRESPQSVRR